MKGEQLNNFIEHLLPSPDPAHETSGETSSPSSPGSNRPGPGSTGFAMDSETLVYYQWAQRAWQRQGRLKSSAIVDEAGSSESTSDEPLPPNELPGWEDYPEWEPLDPEKKKRDDARLKKQRKLWAYRQRTMNWANPYTWTRASFRRKLNQRFVESLMMWPPYWTSDRPVLGPEAMASWRSRALSHLSILLGE